MVASLKEFMEPDLPAVGALLARMFPEGIRRVLLVNPPDGHSELFRPATALRRRYTNSPPYGLGVLAQHLRTAGVEPQLANLNHEVLKAARRDGSFIFDRVWQHALNAAIEKFRPDLIAVTCMFTMTHVSLKRVCEHASLS